MTVVLSLGRYFIQHWTEIGLLVGGVWALYQYRAQRRDRKFDTYYKNIEKLENLKGTAGQCYQLAVIYELRSYSCYFPVTKRILNNLKSKWTMENVDNSIIIEIDLTLEYISKSWLKRHTWGNN